METVADDSVSDIANSKPSEVDAQTQSSDDTQKQRNISSEIDSYRMIKPIATIRVAAKDDKKHIDRFERFVHEAAENNKKEYSPHKPQLIRPMSLFLDDEYTKIKNSVSLSWKNITYCLPKKNGETTIFKDISGYVENGDVLFLLSPNKTERATLLELLSGRRRNYKGDIYYDGKIKPQDIDSSDNMGYKLNAVVISKDDLLIQSLTVSETLKYAALFKMHPSEQNVPLLVGNMIEFLELTSIADCRICDLSEGDKRKVLIGTEIMNEPSLLFMDEILSGLDISSSYEIMNIIEILSRKGYTIIMSLSNSSSRIYEIICESEKNNLFLLNQGKSVFFGKVYNMIEYFEDNGYKIPIHTNPLDHILDLMNDEYLELNTIYDNKLKQEIIKQVETVNKQRGEFVSPKLEKSRRHFCTQFTLLLRRNLINYSRDPNYYRRRLLMTFISCVMIGTMYWRIGDSESHVQDRINLIFFILCVLSIITMRSLSAFMKEKKILKRENINNHYSVFAYSASNFVSSLPFLLLMALNASTSIYLTVQTKSGASFYFMHFAIILITLVVSEALMIQIVTMMKNIGDAVSISVIILVLSMLISGFFVNPAHIPIWWIWLHYALPFHTYSFRLLMTTSFEGCSKGDINGTNVLEQYDMEHQPTSIFWLVLLFTTAIIRITSYVCLRRINKHK